MENFLKDYHIEGVHQRVNNAINLKNIEIIKDVIASNEFSTLNKSEKETEVFSAIYNAVSILNKGQNFLHYIIFEYNISEHNSINRITVDDTVKKMFESRALSSELSTELNSKDKFINKAIKI